MIRNGKYLLFIFLFLLTACSEPPTPTEKTESKAIADIILINGNVYSLNWSEPKPNGTPAADSPYNNGQ